MIKKDRTGQEIWVECDNCGLPQFGGFTGLTIPEVMQPLKYQGWTFGKKIKCPYCGPKKGES